MTVTYGMTCQVIICGLSSLLKVYFPLNLSYEPLMIQRLAMRCNEQECTAASNLTRMFYLSPLACTMGVG